MANLKPQSKREEFRRYLEKAGVMDALTRVLVGLYEEPERPASAIEYFLDRLGSGVPLKAEVETLQNEVSELQKKIQDMEEENANLRKRLEALEAEEGTNVAGSGEVEEEQAPVSEPDAGAEAD